MHVRCAQPAGSARYHIPNGGSNGMLNVVRREDVGARGILSWSPVL